jgi:predicted TIM-barrel fold metal-dependent hydrolase
MSGYDLNWLISVDDHVLEPPDLWTSRLPKKYQEIGPRLITEPNGGHVWAYEDLRERVSGLSAVAGTDKANWTMAAVSYDDMRPGYYDPVARIADMDVAGILVSMCFPSFSRFCGQSFYEAKDKELAMLCVKAYNDWMLEDWCAAAPGRYIPLNVIPLWDPPAAAEEIRRNAARGSRAICFSENPEPLGLPTIWDPERYWNPVWDACQETGTIVCLHIGSSSRIPKISDGMPWSFNQAWAAGAVSSGTMTEWLIGPVFREFPGVKIALSEGGIGWIPYFLERAVQIIDRRGALLAKGETPSGQGVFFDQSQAIELRDFDVWGTFREHIFGCFIDDFYGVKNVREVGIDNVMVEVDYPHSDSTWPTCIEHAHKQLEQNPSLTDEEKYKLLRANAERLFQFTPSAPPAGK